MFARRTVGPGLPLLLIAVAVAPAATAHHSFAEYDMENPVTVTGAVLRIEWTNPHPSLVLAVDDGRGGMVEWRIEMMSLNHLRSYGWTRNTVAVGDLISCTGGRARSGDTAMIASLVELPDGRMLKS